MGSIIVLATFSFFFLSYPTSTGAHTTSIQSGQWLENLPQLGYEEIIRQIWGPMKLNITAPRWTDPETNKLYRLPSKSPWTEKLGKRVCILDVDTRPFENEGELFSEDPWEWTKVEHLSSGMMGHYMYCKFFFFIFEAHSHEEYSLTRPPQPSFMVTITSCSALQSTPTDMTLGAKC